MGFFTHDMLGFVAGLIGSPAPSTGSSGSTGSDSGSAALFGAMPF